MLSRFLLPALAVGLAMPALAQKAQPASALEVGTDPVAELSADGQTYLRSARPAMMTGLDAPAIGATAEAQARDFLATRSGLFGFRAAGTSDLALVTSRKGDIGAVVKFQQTVDGVPVWNAVTAVNIDRDDRVQLVANGYRADLSAVDTAPAVSEDDARATVLAHLGVTDTEEHLASELIVWPTAPAALAWRVETEAIGGAWEGVVDAHTGELLRATDRATYHDDDEPRPSALPLADYHPAFRVDGTGMVFDPDPLTRAQVPRGTTGYTDGNDADTPQLTAARVMRTLENIELSGGLYKLSNEYSEVTDWDPQGPNNGLFRQASPDFDYTRNEDAFEAVTTFWHISNFMRYMNEDLNVEVSPYRYTTGVRFDPHGLDGADNSFYTGQTQRLSFGEGCVDDAEDADVILHELGHGLHHWLVGTGGGPSNGDGFSEGFGDYVANSYVRSLGLLAPSDPAYNRVFRWDGYYSFCWGGRTTNYTANYPTGGLPHQRGQHFSTSNLRVWDLIGGEKTDKAVFEGLTMTTPSSSQPQAAQAILQAAANLGYTQAEVDAFFNSYVDQGYNVSPVVTAEDAAAAELAGVLVSAAAPNPFNGLTTFDVMVASPQAVSVEVFDAVGRRVAVLFEGEMTAGQRFPLSLDAAALRSGVYVVRVTGESVATTRRVTVVR